MVATSAALPLAMSANCLSQNAAIGTVTLFTVFPGFSASNFCLSSVITGSLFGSPHMKLGQLISAALVVNDQHRTAKINVASRKRFITSSSSFTRYDIGDFDRCCGATRPHHCFASSRSEGPAAEG